MENVHDDIQEQLFNYLDGKLSVKERIQFETLLKSDASLNAFYKDLLRSEEFLQAQLEDPSYNFTSSVMAQLSEPRSSSSIYKSVILLVGVLTVIIASLVLVQRGLFDNVITSINITTLHLPESLLPHQAFSLILNTKTIINIIVAANIILAWMILDFAILKPLFHRRLRSS